MNRIGNGINKIESISFIKKIPAGSSEWLAERVKADGTIEAIKIKFNAGQEGALQVRPVVEHKGGKIEDLVTYPATTDTSMSGDADYFEMKVNVPVSNDDYIKIHVVNSGPYTYTCNCQVEIDYYGGNKRVVGGSI